MGDDNKKPEQIAAEAAAKREEQARLDELNGGPEITTQAVSTPSAAITAIDNAYKDPIKELGDSITALEQARKDAYANDEVAQRKSRNMQMIAGLSDGLASLANMIGVGSYNASPMNLTGASPELAKRFEAARQERKSDIKSIDDRLDQKRRELQAMKMQYGVARASQLDREKERVEDRIARAELEKARIKAEKEKQATQNAFTADQQEKQREWQAGQNAADRSSREAINDADNAAAKERAEAKSKADPDYKKTKMRENIVGIRDELASDMGYTDYNEYLRYKNVSGWGTDIEGQRNKESKRIREKRAADYPEVKELLDMLANPESLTDEEIDMLISASGTFADAVNSASGKSSSGKVDDYSDL